MVAGAARIGRPAGGECCFEARQVFKIRRKQDDATGGLHFISRRHGSPAQYQAAAQLRGSIRAAQKLEDKHDWAPLGSELFWSASVTDGAGVASARSKKPRIFMRGLLLRVDGLSGTGGAGRN
ncbi:hypothetical protein [Rhizobium acidisoli]|uniref:hypothetical protein n=1 Tax=Rhizobium acidisoli TaxID=1538158 RepID=UPI001FD9897E|nr:hypothetical protein [Rhizobium acidisoli]